MHGKVAKMAPLGYMQAMSNAQRSKAGLLILHLMRPRATNGLRYDTYCSLNKFPFFSSDRLKDGLVIAIISLTMSILHATRRSDRRRPAGWLPALTVVISLGAIAVLGAQNQVPPLSTGGPGQSPIFRSGVTLVTTDVVVRDGDGVFLPDLTPSEFIVEEDGVRQEVASLVLVHGGRVYNQLTPPVPTQEGIILPPTRPTNNTAGRIIILFVDDLHLQTSYTPKVRQVFRTISDTLIHEGDLFGIISTGPSSLSIDLTYDRSLLRAAEERIMGDGFSPRELIQTVSDGYRGPPELLFRQHVAFKTARQVIQNLEAVENRRKVFIYISSGYDFTAFADDRIYGAGGIGEAFKANRDWGTPLPAGLSQAQNPAEDPFERLSRAGQVFADGDLAMEILELTRAANRANTSFYTVDPRGLIAGADIDFDVTPEDWNQYVFKTQGSLRGLAELTGGMAIVNRNDFENAFREVDAETSDYYVLGYYSNNPDPTQRTRRLNVEVARDNVDVRSRTSYTFARPESTSAALQ